MSIGIAHGGLSLRVREIVRGGVLVVGSYGVTPSDLAAALVLLERHDARGMALFDRTFAIEQSEDAFRYATHSSGKVLLSIGAEARPDERC